MAFRPCQKIKKNIMRAPNVLVHAQSRIISVFVAISNTYSPFLNIFVFGNPIYTIFIMFEQPINFVGFKGSNRCCLVQEYRCLRMSESYKKKKNKSCNPSSLTAPFSHISGHSSLVLQRSLFLFCFCFFFL